MFNELPLPLHLAKQGLEMMSRWTGAFTDVWGPPFGAIPSDARTAKGDDVFAFAPLGPFAPGWEYLIDAGQRTGLFLDVLRERGNQYLAQSSKIAPHVLEFSVGKEDLVMDGRALERPVNYILVRIKPPAGQRVDPKNRPFVVIDPRAGHGPGIGGFNPTSATQP